MSTTKAPTAASLQVNNETVRIPRESGWYEPTENLKRDLRYDDEVRATPQDIARVIETGEIARVEERPAPSRLSKSRPEITYRGKLSNGQHVEVDVSPAGQLVGPAGTEGSAVVDGVCQMKILRASKAYHPYTEPISNQTHEEEEADEESSVGQSWPVDS